MVEPLPICVFQYCIHNQTTSQAWIFGGGLMEYYKLIALSIGDFSSTIFFENNYELIDFKEVSDMKQELEEKGYTCLLAKMCTNIETK